MDHARKIGKIEKPFTWRKTPSPPCSISDKPLIEDDVITEDRRLANWRKWLANRKNHSRIYKAHTHRDNENLLINTSEKFRRTVEMKDLMECAGGAMKIDKYRGDPGFWITPEFLPKRGNPDLPDIAITLTKKQRNVAPIIERIGLPQLTQEEKGLHFQTDKEPLWKRNEYLKRRKKQLSREIKLLQAKEPEIDKLSIKGKGLGGTKSEQLKIPTVRITPVEPIEFSTVSTDKQENDIVLKVQDHVITLGEKPCNENLDEFSLVFKSSGLSIVEREIRLENLGTCTITYHWDCGSLGSTVIPSTPRSSPFFFNKNKDLLLPGQIVVLKVWFRSHVSCSVTEFWTLITDPKIRAIPFVFRFWGCCRPDPLRDENSSFVADARSIESYLNGRIRDTTIHGIINEILDNVQTKTLASPAYKSLFVESEIFRAKNPHYFYHPAIIQELRTIYDNATSTDSPGWSLSLEDLRQVLLKLKKPQLRSEALLRFNELCRDCLQPSLYNPEGNSKEAMVYNLLCSFANKFEAEAEHVKNKCSRKDVCLRVLKETENDTSRSTSVSRMSQGSLTPRGKSRKTSRPRLPTRARTTSKTNISIPTNLGTAAVILSEEKSENECRLYKEVLIVRIREMLGNTISNVCGIVDTFNNLSGSKK